jgi:radical SAM protein with 4Fe4S-binding SPASM domain
MITVNNNTGLRYQFNKLTNKVAPRLYEYNLRRKLLFQDTITQPVIKNLVDSFDGRLFDRVEIETINRCNNHCSFCPVHNGADPRELSKMTDDTFNKIICELSEMSFTGHIALFSNNEPLLDKKLLQRAKYAATKLPYAFHYLYTNGTLLDEAKFLGLMESLDLLIIDNYQDELLPGVQTIYKKYHEDPRYKDRVIIQMRRTDEILTNRGGQAGNRQSVRGLKSSCIMPFTQMVIRPDGKVSLCCNDALGKYTMGDVTTQSLKDIWFNQKYERVRNALKSGRSGLALCGDCDVLYDKLELFSMKKTA